jgi:hypothetical protein
MVSVPDQHPLRIVAAPLHGPTVTKREMKLALDLGACSIGWSEADRRIPYLRRRPSWRIAVGRSDDPRVLRGPGDVPISVRRHHRPLERYAFKACERAEPIELAPERWVIGFAYEHPLGDIEHINHHPNPFNAPRATLSLRREYRQSMLALERAGERALRKRRLLVITGDMNLTARSPLEYAPRQVFDRLNLKWWTNEVVWIAHHRSLIPIERRTVTTNGQDHPWLVIDFEGWRR